MQQVLIIQATGELPICYHEHPRKTIRGIDKLAHWRHIAAARLLGDFHNFALRHTLSLSRPTEITHPLALSQI